MLITTVTQKGQATIPLPIRLLLGIKAGSKVQFVEENGAVLLKLAPDFFSFRGALKGKRLPTNREIEEISAKEAVSRYLKTFEK